MKPEKIKITAKQAEGLLADIHALPAEPLGKCLDDHQFAGYAAGMLSEDEVRIIDEHLISCSTCADELLLIFEALEPEPSSVIEPVCSPTKSLSERLKDALRDATENWRNSDLAWAAAPIGRREVWNYQSPNGLIRGHAVLTEENELVYRFVSNDKNLEGNRFRIRLGSTHFDKRWKLVSETEVGVKIVVQADERPSDPTDISFDSD